MERFFSKIRKKANGCWEWGASLRGKTGYGAFKFQGKVVDAHRLSFIIHKGYIPDGFYVCHKCNNRLCVNPDHLLLGTPSDNHRDGVLFGNIKPPTNEHLKKHPSESAYKRGCRCKECIIVHNSNLHRKKMYTRAIRALIKAGGLKAPDQVQN